MEDLIKINLIPSNLCSKRKMTYIDGHFSFFYEFEPTIYPMTFLVRNENEDDYEAYIEVENDEEITEIVDLESYGFEYEGNYYYYYFSNFDFDLVDENYLLKFNLKLPKHWLYITNTKIKIFIEDPKTNKILLLNNIPNTDYGGYFCLGYINDPNNHLFIYNKILNSPFNTDYKDCRIYDFYQYLFFDRSKPFDVLNTNLYHLNEIIDFHKKTLNISIDIPNYVNNLHYSFNKNFVYNFITKVNGKNNFNTNDFLNIYLPHNLNYYYNSDFFKELV